MADKVTCCLGRRPECFPTDPALHWWRTTRPRHNEAHKHCMCVQSGYCASTTSFQRWLRDEHGIIVPDNMLHMGGGQLPRGFTYYVADRVACAANTHPSEWWPEWYDLS